LLGFVAERTNTASCRLDAADLKAPLVAEFLEGDRPLPDGGAG